MSNSKMMFIQSNSFTNRLILKFSKGKNNSKVQNKIFKYMNQFSPFNFQIDSIVFDIRIQLCRGNDILEEILQQHIQIKDISDAQFTQNISDLTLTDFIQIKFDSIQIHNIGVNFESSKLFLYDFTNQTFKFFQNQVQINCDESDMNLKVDKERIDESVESLNRSIQIDKFNSLRKSQNIGLFTEAIMHKFNQLQEYIQSDALFLFFYVEDYGVYKPILFCDSREQSTTLSNTFNNPRVNNFNQLNQQEIPQQENIEECVYPSLQKHFKLNDNNEWDMIVPENEFLKPQNEITIENILNSQNANPGESIDFDTPFQSSWVDCQSKLDKNNPSKQEETVIKRELQQLMPWKIEKQPQDLRLFVTQKIWVKNTALKNVNEQYLKNIPFMLLLIKDENEFDKVKIFLEEFMRKSFYISNDYEALFALSYLYNTNPEYISGSSTKNWNFKKKNLYQLRFKAVEYLYENQSEGQICDLLMPHLVEALKYEGTKQSNINLRDEKESRIKMSLKFKDPDGNHEHIEIYSQLFKYLLLCAEKSSSQALYLLHALQVNCELDSVRSKNKDIDKTNKYGFYSQFQEMQLKFIKTKEDIQKAVDKTQKLQEKYIRPLWNWIKNDSAHLKTDQDKKPEIIAKLEETNKFISDDAIKPIFHIEPSYSIKRIIIVDENGNSKFKVFNSANKPILLELELVNAHGQTRIDQLIYKQGDDMRQDLLIINFKQFISHQFIKNKNKDSHLTAQKVVVFSLKDGLMEFVRNSKDVADILKEKIDSKDNKIENQLRTHNPDTQDIAIDKQVQSNAAQAVFSQIFGLGDRHNNNLFPLLLLLFNNFGMPMVLPIFFKKPVPEWC